MSKSIVSATAQNNLAESNLQSLPVDERVRIDDSIIDLFPAGTKCTLTTLHGSTWNMTALLTVQSLDGKKQLYFLKCTSNKIGRVMMEGEYNAMSELYKFMPNFVPKPHSWGKFTCEFPQTYFFVSQFIEMDNQLPEPEQLCKKLAQLHKDSVSPTGKFGFHITTCQGQIPQETGRWEAKWTNLFLKLFQNVISLDFNANGCWVAFDTLAKRITSHVIPRLIGNLERDGRIVKPCLIHADLWEGNTGTSYETGDIYIFDSGAYYAHNEMEIGDWRCHYNKIHNKIYTKTYLKYYGPSEPRVEWDDRNRMYCVYYNVIYSVNHLAQGKAVRQTAFDDMYYLIDKFAPFPEGEGPPRLDDAERAGLSAERDHTAE